MKIPFRQYLALLSRYMQPQRGRVILLTVLLFGGLGLQLIGPQVLRYFIDRAMNGSGAAALLPIALLFIGLALVAQILNIWATYVSQNVGWTATNALRKDLAEHCLNLDMPFHNAHTPGELIERIDGDITAMANFFSQMVIQVLGNLLLLLGVLVLLWQEDWRVGLALTIFSIFAIWVLNLVRNIAVPRLTAESKSRANLYSYLEERLSGTEDIRSSGAREHVMNGLYLALREVFHRGRASGTVFALVWSISNAMFLISYILIFGSGAYLFSVGAITLGTVYLFFQYTEMLRAPLEQMTRQVQELQKATAGIHRVQELYNTVSKIQDGSGQQHLPAGPLSVEFDQVFFTYNDNDNNNNDDNEAANNKSNAENMVLKNLNFKLEAGKVMGLLGRTGSGKTSTTRLLFRLYEASQGAIRLAGIDSRDLKLADLRQHIAMVTQEVQIFHASVRDNLTFFNKNILDEQILQVIEELGLKEWYERMPRGLDTILRESGSGLSAGEAQLLAFTRVFLENPGLVILDEASSRLDPATERLIERAVDKLMKNRTGIIIAHRLATVQRADEIMILENGRVLEHGSRELLANDAHSRFAQLMRTGLEEALA